MADQCEFNVVSCVCVCAPSLQTVLNEISLCSHPPYMHKYTAFLLADTGLPVECVKETIVYSFLGVNVVSLHTQFSCNVLCS